MIPDPLDKPNPVTVSCKLCGRPLKADWHWLLDRWLRPTVHDQCAEDFDRKHRDQQHIPAERPIPERFAHFEAGRADSDALAACGAFLPSHPYATLALIGERGRGKSRLMWAVVQSYFDELRLETGAERWPEYFLFSDLMTGADKFVWARLKEARFVFIDNIGESPSYGRDKAALQAVIRFRLQNDRHTFLTIDDPDFDPGFKDLFRDRALEVYIE